MRYIKRLDEVIKIPIKVGDTVLGGRFKNKKIVVKKIDKNDKGDITINGKPLLKFRIVKESVSFDKIEEDVTEYLSHLEDDGFRIDCSGSQAVGRPIVNNYYIRIFNPSSGTKFLYGSCRIINWSDIESDVNRFIKLSDLEVDYIYFIVQSKMEPKHVDRVEVTLYQLLNSDFEINGDILSLVIGFKKEVSTLAE